VGSEEAAGRVESDIVSNIKQQHQLLDEHVSGLSECHNFPTTSRSHRSSQRLSILVL
jgi:hypothetical protein